MSVFFANISKISLTSECACSSHLSAQRDGSGVVMSLGTGTLPTWCQQGSYISWMFAWCLSKCSFRNYSRMINNKQTRLPRRWMDKGLHQRPIKGTDVLFFLINWQKYWNITNDCCEFWTCEDNKLCNFPLFDVTSGVNIWLLKPPYFQM